MQERILRTMAALEKNNMKAYYAESREQLHNLVRSLVNGRPADNRRRFSEPWRNPREALLMTEFRGIYP